MKLPLIILLVCICPLCWAIDDDVYLTISKQGSGKTPIGLMCLRDMHNSRQTRTTREMDEILRFDLSISGYFKVYQEKEMDPEERRDVNHLQADPLYATALRAIIFGSVVESGDSLVLNGFIRDPFTSERLLKRKYRGKRSSLRKIVHTFSDDIILHLTGEKGFCRSQIVAVWRKKDCQDIVRMDYDGHNMVTLIKNNSLNTSPKLSDDRRKVCFVSYQRGYPDIYVYTIADKRLTQITRNRHTCNAPAFSHDGSSLAFSMAVNGNSDIFMIRNLQAPQVERLTFANSIETSPTFSPDDKRLVYTSDRAGIPNIYSMDVTGANSRRLTYGGQYYESPDWSMDGNLIAFVSMNAKRFDLFVMDIDGANPERLTAFQGSNENPSFCPFQRLLVYASDRDGVYRLYLTNTNGDFDVAITPRRLNILQPHWR